MKFDHSFKHHDVSQALMTYLEEKMDKLHKYDIKPSNAHVTYSMQRHRCLIEINLLGGESTFKAKADESDWHASVDQLVNRLEHQMKKRKTIVKQHRDPKKAKRERFELLHEQLGSGKLEDDGKFYGEEDYKKAV